MIHNNYIVLKKIYTYCKTSFSRAIQSIRSTDKTCLRTSIYYNIYIIIVLLI